MILTGKNTDFIAIFDCTKQVSIQFTNLVKL